MVWLVTKGDINLNGFYCSFEKQTLDVLYSLINGTDCVLNMKNVGIQIYFVPW